MSEIKIDISNSNRTDTPEGTKSYYHDIVERERLQRERLDQSRRDECVTPQTQPQPQPPESSD
jgi:hypothetical protein